MEKSQCLPKFFALSEDGNLKVYENVIYQSFNTLGFPANIVSPLMNLPEFDQIMIERAEVTILNATFIRKWNGRNYRSATWNLSNSYLKTATDIIPVIEITESATSLPYNNIYYIPKYIRISNDATYERFSEASSVIKEPAVFKIFSGFPLLGKNTE